jgi:GNAT superfamily N-acetyltransferase
MNDRYRTADLKDLAALAEMRWHFKMEDDNESERMNKQRFIKVCTRFLKDGLKKRQWCIWIAEVEHEIVSHIFIRRISKVPKPNRVADEFGYITNVYTKPEYRGRGIGTKLLKQVIAWAREEDFEFLLVWLAEESEDWYWRHGFEKSLGALELPLRPYAG